MNFTIARKKNIPFTEKFETVGATLKSSRQNSLKEKVAKLRKWIKLIKIILI